MIKHFVIFFSPGTVVAETSQKEIDSWDINEAIGMFKDIKERYGSTPYGFQFITRERKEDDFDSKEVKSSGIYYLGGTIMTLDEVKAKNDPKDETLISNMECNKCKRIVINNNSWKWTQPLTNEDVVLDL